MAVNFTRRQRFYPVLETTYGVAVPPTNSDAVRFMSGTTIKYDVGQLMRRDKTGSRSTTVGDAGRHSGSWNYTGSLATSGVAGTLPDQDVFWVCLFGTAGQVYTGTINATGATNATPIVVTAAGHGLVTGQLVKNSGFVGNTGANGNFFVEVVDANSFKLIGSVGNGAWVSGGIINKSAIAYRFSDVIKSFSFWEYVDTPHTQQAAFGCVVQSARFTLGQDVADVTVSGEPRAVLTDSGFSTADDEEKGGLVSYPAEPGSPVTSGGLIPGYKGLAVIDGTKYGKITTMNIDIATANALPHNDFGTDYATEPEGDERSITVGWSMAEDTATAAAQAALYEKAKLQTPIDVAAIIGKVPGSIYGLYCKGVQLPVPTREENGRRFARSVSGAKAHGSSLSSLDEVVLWVG